jgi:hypothetical protein
MQVLDIKRGHYQNIEGAKLEELMKEIFGSVDRDGDKLVANYGAMQPITAWVKSKKELCVDIVTATGIDDQTVLETIRLKNDFLQRATGFSTKERSKRLQKKAKEGKL